MVNHMNDGVDLEGRLDLYTNGSPVWVPIRGRKPLVGNRQENGKMTVVYDTVRVWNAGGNPFIERYV
jgi:hypothetical protein